MNLADVVAEMPDNLDERPTDDTTTDTGAPPADSQADRGDAGDSNDGGGEGDAKGGPEGDSGGDNKDKGADDSGSSDDSDEGYVADESDDDEGEQEPPKQEPAPQDLSPELKYIVDRLPVLSTRGKDGKTYQVKAAGQLPDDFEFATKRDELLFTQALTSQELKAQQLQYEYNQGQQNQAAQEFSEKENRDIRRDIGDLQRDGKLGRFKYAPDDAKFNEDPAVVEANKVIDFMNKTNAKYLEDANKGGVLYHLSFKDAYNLMPRETTKQTAQQKEDTERKQAVRKTAGAASSAPSAQKAPASAYTGSLTDLVDMMDF